jgi:hypothetical protein
MSEFKAGKLRTTDGSPVSDRKQAVAIALSEAREESKQPLRRKRPTSLAL